MSRIVKSWHTIIEETTVTIGDIVAESAKPASYEPSKDTDTAGTDGDNTPTEPKEPAIDLVAVRKEAEAIKNTMKEEARAYSDDIIKKALEKAEKIKQEALDNANAKATEIKEQAQNDGYEAGINSAKDKAAEIVALAEEVKAKAHIYKEELIQGIEPEMIELITSVLDNLIEIEKEINPGAISILIKNGLGKTSTTQDIVVHTSPDDYPSIDKAMILSSAQSMTDIQFVEDPTLKKLDCIIKTPLGSIDCGLDTQYKSLRKNLHYILKNK